MNKLLESDETIAKLPAERLCELMDRARLNGTPNGPLIAFYLSMAGLSWAAIRSLAA